MSSQSSGRRRLNNRQFSAEDEALDIISKEAEARLDAKRAARAEAREIRLKELEKQQNESEGKQDGEYTSNKVRQQLSGSRSASRQGSTESDAELKGTDFKAELRELQEKYKAAMVTSAQLDNEKQSLVYQVELLKDELDEQSEQYIELQREYKEKCRLYDFQKRDLKSLEQEMSILKQQLEIKDRLIQDSGFVIIANDKGEPMLQKSSQIISTNGPLPGRSLPVSAETQDLLKKTEGATLGTAVGGINTNKSSGSQQAGNSVTSSSVDACDGSVVEQIQLSEKCSEENFSKAGENLLPYNSNTEKVVDVVLHDSDDVVDSESVLQEHNMSNTSSLERGDVGRMPEQNESRVSVSAGAKAHSERNLTTQEKDTTHIGMETDGLTPQATTTESDKDSGDNETDEVDEFFDAISTPSLFSKTDNFTEQGVGDQKILTNDKEGTSVDPEPETEKNIIRLEASSTDFTNRDRGSIFLDNVTETESSTDVVNENEDTHNKENILETEDMTVVDHDKNEDEQAKDEIETHGQNIILEASQNEPIDAGKFVEEFSPENKSNEEENLEVQSSHKDSETVPSDVFNDNTEASQHEQEEEVQHVAEDVREIVEENFESRTEVQISQAPTSEKLDNGEDTATEGEIVEVLMESISIESSACPNEDKEIQVVVDETNIDQSAISESQDKSSESNYKDEEFALKDNLEKQDSHDEGDLEDIEVSKEGENREENSQVISDEENDEKNEVSTTKGTSKVVVRTTSGGESEASGGVDLDDYDLDDIDDILSTDAQPSAEAVELNTTLSPKTQPANTASTVDQVDSSHPRSPGYKHIEGKEVTTAPDGKKSKSDKKKSSKKESKEKAEKIKSGEKETKNKGEKIKSSEKESKSKTEKRKSSEKEGKEKAEKVKSKEKESKDKTDKNKSSKRDSTLEKKAEKSKSKKETAQESKAEATGGEEDRHSTAESQGSQEPDDLEQALDKQMLESERSKSDKKSPKKLSIFKKVFK